VTASRDAIQQVREVERLGKTCLAVEYPSRTYIYLITDHDEKRAVAMWEELDGEAYAVRSKWDFIHASTELGERFDWTTVLDQDLTQISQTPRKKVILD
jgi:hypothetical protein